MRIEYYDASDVKKLADEIAERLDFFNILPQFVYCVRSKDSRSKGIIARIHGLGRIWQHTLGHPPIYVIEVISERYDRLSAEEKEKTIIHELLHIPYGFTGGFRHEGYVKKRIIHQLHKELKDKRTASKKPANNQVINENDV